MVVGGFGMFWLVVAKKPAGVGFFRGGMVAAFRQKHSKTGKTKPGVGLSDGAFRAFGRPGGNLVVWLCASFVSTTKRKDPET